MATYQQCLDERARLSRRRVTARVIRAPRVEGQPDPADENDFLLQIKDPRTSTGPHIAECTFGWVDIFTGTFSYTDQAHNLLGTWRDITQFRDKQRKTGDQHTGGGYWLTQDPVARRDWLLPNIYRQSSQHWLGGGFPSVNPNYPS